jgi:uncharacterized protein
LAFLEAHGVKAIVALPACTTLDEPRKAMAPPTDLTSDRGPLTQNERILAIDVLRGVALLGILIMNIQSFSMIGAAYENPTAYGDLTGVNYAVWLGGRFVADQRFMSIFAMLFGAGIVLITQRQEAAGGRPARIHFRRSGLLILFGLLHAYLLWDGDILYTYGVCALAAYFFRRLSPRWLMAIGMALLLVPPIFNHAMALALPHLREETRAEFERGWRPSPEEIQKELAAYRGSWLDEMRFRVPSSFMMETVIFAFWTSWRAGGLMLIGMALFKLGVFTGSRSAGCYFWFIGACLPIGTLLTALGVRHDFAHDWDLSCLFIGMNYNYFGSLFTSFAWIGLIMLLCKFQVWPRLLARCAAVGQTAFSNYILQTLICTTFFYGHGFGLFGKVQRIDQFLLVCAIWALQLLVSAWWLKKFRAGPLEWVWRWLTYGQRQPFRKNRTGQDDSQNP